MPIRLYDTLTRRKQELTPADPSRITMYVCGPTVYSRPHIGNARPAVVFDVLARLLRHSYGADSLVYARNITDIDDKIMAAASIDGVAIGDISAKFEQYYLADMTALGVAPPDVAPHATAYIAEMVTMIATLVDAGYAYTAAGHVLFDTGSYVNYGRLSGRPLDAMIAGARVEVAPYKRQPADFILWKPSSETQAGWPSPWGRGRPGWHIECSAMIRTVLGETIDIHGGGLDLVFPHHENELAQSSCANHGAPLARIWMHNGFLAAGADKMSKSLGNIETVEALLTAGWSGDVLRLALLGAHYRQPLDWTPALLAQSKATLTRWQRLLETTDRAASPHPTVVAALADDLNTPAALAALGQLATNGDVAALRGSLRLLGFGDAQAPAVDARIDREVAARSAARAARDFAKSDQIRDMLAAEGIILEDGDGGTRWRRA